MATGLVFWLFTNIRKLRFFRRSLLSLNLSYSSFFIPLLKIHPGVKSFFTLSSGSDNEKKTFLFVVKIAIFHVLSGLMEKF